MTAVGWLGYNTTCQFSVAYTASQKLLEIVLKSGIHFSHVNSHNCAKLDEIWLLHAPGKVGDWERHAFFPSLPGGDIISSSSPCDEQCPQTRQVIWLYIYKTLWQNDGRRLELCCKMMEEIQMASWFGFFFLFPSNRFVPDVWILIISLGLNSRHNIDFCLMRERESEDPS